MRVKFVRVPTGGRDHKIGDVVDVPHDYARKYIDKGWAEEHKEELSKPAFDKPLAAAKVVQGGYHAPIGTMATIEPGWSKTNPVFEPAVPRAGSGVATTAGKK